MAALLTSLTTVATVQAGEIYAPWANYSVGAASLPIGRHKESLVLSGSRGTGAMPDTAVVMASNLAAEEGGFIIADDSQEMLKTARKLGGVGKFSEAVDVLSKLIVEHSDLAEAYAERSVNYSRQIRPSKQSKDKDVLSSKAIADADKAIELDGANPSYRLVRGFAFEVSGQFAVPVEDYSELVRLRPNEASSWSSRRGFT